MLDDSRYVLFILDVLLECNTCYRVDVEGYVAAVEFQVVFLFA